VCRWKGEGDDGEGVYINVRERSTGLLCAHLNKQPPPPPPNEKGKNNYDIKRTSLPFRMIYSPSGTFQRKKHTCYNMNVYSFHVKLVVTLPTVEK